MYETNTNLGRDRCSTLNNNFWRVLTDIHHFGRSPVIPSKWFAIDIYIQFVRLILIQQFNDTIEVVNINKN